MNPTPFLEMGSEACWWTKVPFRHSNKYGLKRKLIRNMKAQVRHLERGESPQQIRPLGKTLKKDPISHLDIL
jgi:hypothetical protein